MQYRTKTKKIEAVRWTGKNFKEVDDFLMSFGTLIDWDYQTDVPELVVRIGPNDIHAKAGDWIVTCRSGSLCVCDDGIFQQTYEPCEE